MLLGLLCLLERRCGKRHRTLARAGVIDVQVDMSRLDLSMSMSRLMGAHPFLGIVAGLRLKRRVPPRAAQLSHPEVTNRKGDIRGRGPLQPRIVSLLAGPLAETLLQATCSGADSKQI